MYLKSIKVQGFKSFADKLNIDFGQNINGIVGPNGSGKSNIVDAVRFVLGEQSSKNLRGDGNMMDVIFTGSKTRNGANSASVTLVFDNSDNHLPISYSEISIKRTIYKTGENDYYLNNEKCRLKDITDLLTDSAASRSSFNIISQGKIADILSNRPIDRRFIIEEAAGVLKYKKRKEEALRKLDRTHLNLNRINDIINELNTQIEPLKEQSNQAKIYLENKDKLSNLEIALVTNDIYEFNYKYKDLNKQIEAINESIVSISTNGSNSDVEIEINKKQLKELEDEITSKQSLLLTETELLESLNTKLKLLRERSKYKLDDEIVNINILELKEKIINKENDINLIKNEIEIINKESNNLIFNNNIMLEKYNDIKNNIDKININIDKNNRLINDLEYKISNLENIINNNSSLPSSVKAILDNPKFTGIHNVIGKLIDTTDKFATALNIALGASSSYLVVDNENIAASCISYLKENYIGRATFYPLNIIKGRTIDNDTLELLKKENNFINTFDKLVTYDKKYYNIILRELGCVIVTDNIVSANAISKKINGRYKIVTLDGQVVNAGGSITGGNIYKQNNVIQDKYRLGNYKKELNDVLNNVSQEKQKLITYNKEMIVLSNEIDKLRSKNNVLNNDITIKNKNIDLLIYDVDEAKQELKSLENINKNSNSEESKLLDEFAKQTDKKNTLIKDINILKLDKTNISELIENLENENKKVNIFVNKKNKELTELQIQINRLDVKLDTLLNFLNEEYNMTYEKAIEQYKLEMDEGEARAIVAKLKDKMKEIGVVNLGAIEEFERINSRYQFLIKQKEDLNNASNTLLEIITEMDEIMKDKFSNTFENVKKEFTKVFKSLFNGGNASLQLTDENNLLETGVEIVAVPEGKNLKSISLLSGGEKTLTAIALLFAILNIRPVPFCIFDEVEAALDEANVDKFGKYLSMYRDKTQFIIITHKKKTMEYADILYGITMQESGVSKLVSVRLEDSKLSKEVK